jgi:hypothetical protein
LIDDVVNAQTLPMDEAKYNAGAVEELVAKRLHNFDYIKRAHQGSVHWMNTVLLSKEDIINFYGKEKKEVLQKRAEQWFYVGISLAPILTLSSGTPYVVALSTFWDEFEQWGGKPVAPKDNLVDMKQARTGTGSGGNEFLNTPNIPSSLDYFEIVYTLCDLLEHIYKRFLSLDITPQIAKGIAKIDARFMHHILGRISKDLNAISLQLVKQQLAGLDPLFSSGWDETGEKDD